MKNFVKKMTLVSIALLSAVALTACNGGSSAKNSKRNAKGTLNVAATGQIVTQDPIRAEFADDKELIQNTQLPLAELDKDGKTQLAAVEKWEASADKKTFTLTLRSGLKWSDGSPLTAKDYVFGFDAIKNDEKSIYKYTFDTLVNYEAKDDRTLVYTFNLPRPFFEMTDLPGGTPIKEEFYKKVGGAGVYGTSKDTTLYSGAFKIEEWSGKDATSWKLVKNDQYYDAENVLIEAVNTTFIENPQTAQQEFDAGKVDFIELRGRAMHDKYKNSKKVESTQASYYFLKQGKNPDLANKNLRLALDAAIDRSEVVTVAPGYKEFNGAISYNSLFDPSGKDIRNYDSAKLEDRHNEAKAKEYWETAKKELGKSSISLGYLVFNNAQNIAVAQVIKNRIEKTLPGVTINIDPKDNNTYTELQDKGAFDLLFQGWSSFGDPEGTFYPYTNNEWNKSGVTYPEVVAEADKLHKILEEKPSDVDAVFAQTLATEKTLLSTGQMMPLYQKVQTFALNERIETYYQDIMAKKQYRYFVIK